MEVLVAYDVSTVTKAGRRRLRRVAQVCTNYGQRVQQSVFECRVNRAQYEQMLEDLTGEINEKKDSLRIYRIAQPKAESVQSWGNDELVDFDGPLVM